MVKNDKSVAGRTLIQSAHIFGHVPFSQAIEGLKHQL